MKGECNFEEMSKIKGMRSILASRLTWSFASQVNWLEAIRSEGNKMFIERNWAAAVSKYSECINLAGGQLHSNALHDKAIKEKYNRVIMLAYSNRAEANLRLLKYEDALLDADMALQIDSKHAKTLARKGKAAHGLGFFEKACEAFKCALAETPEDWSILKLLRESCVAHEQSRTGVYDLLDFFARISTGDIPFCADFVGPVEIRRASSGHGRWGLFATRSVEPGELLLVNNPLAVVRHETLNPDGTAKYYRAKGFQEKLLQELVERIGRCKLDMARLYSLASKGEGEMEIPSMELFRPGSEWTPPDALTLEVDIDLICNIANAKMLEFMDVTGPGIDLHNGIMGLWVLPAFAKHSCAPNCQHAFVGDTIFFRASGLIMEGDELTVPYFADLFAEVEDRQAISKNWGFTCNCERCLFEKSVQPHFSKLKTTMHEDVAQLPAETDKVFDVMQQRSLRKKLGKSADEVEVVIRSLGTSLSPKQQGWIRAGFSDLYMHKSPCTDHGVDQRPQDQVVFAVRSVVDALTSVYVSPRVLGLTAMLGMRLDRAHSKESQVYNDVRVQFLSVFRRVCGKQSQTWFSTLFRD